MKTRIKLSKDRLLEKTFNKEDKSPGVPGLRSNCPFNVASHFKRNVNYSLGLASFIK